LIPGALVVLIKAWLVFLIVFVWARFSLARIRTDQILEFGWRMLLPLAVLQVVLAAVYRLYLFDLSGMSDSTYGGTAWDAFGIPFLVPALTTILWLALFFLLLNDTGKNERTARMYHVQTVQPAGTHTPGQD
ncbi:MAG TPA: hypothetical protein HA358_01380, partial [Candidatus Poseidoniaceae archaeon]|nr:hypothetical protein [Candidatus Poseidoniaceae archaeon]